MAAAKDTFAIKHNLNGTAAPAVSDDVNAGYQEGSIWIDRTGNAFYVCVDDAAGAAIWDTGGAASLDYKIATGAPANNTDVTVFTGGTPADGGEFLDTANGRLYKWNGSKWVVLITADF